MIRAIPVVLLFAGSMAAAGGQDWHGFGPVDPVDLPDLWAERHDGERVRVRELFHGRRNIVQFIFVDCPLACPLLGSLFRRVDRELMDPTTRLVSITVNPSADTPRRLNNWLRQFQASPRWVGLRLSEADLPVFLRAFRQEAGPPSGHTLQVFFVDGKARYVGRTTDMPNAATVAAQLNAALRPPDRAGAPPRQAGPHTGRELFTGQAAMAASASGDPVAAAAGRCSSCHGEAGEGNGEGKTRVPAIRGAELTSERSRRGGPPSRYTVESFCGALRSGVDPAGVRYSDLMPRYAIDGRTCRLLWDFLTNGPPL